MSKIVKRVRDKARKLAKLVAEYHDLQDKAYVYEDACSPEYKEAYRVEVDEEGNRVELPKRKSLQLHLSRKGVEKHIIHQFETGKMSERAIDIMIQLNLKHKKESKDD